jgi:hypothetical protein
MSSLRALAADGRWPGRTTITEPARVGPAINDFGSSTFGARRLLHLRPASTSPRADRGSATATARHLMPSALFGASIAGCLPAGQRDAGVGRRAARSGRIDTKVRGRVRPARHPRRGEQGRRPGESSGSIRASINDTWPVRQSSAPPHHRPIARRGQRRRSRLLSTVWISDQPPGCGCISWDSPERPGPKGMSVTRGRGLGDLRRLIEHQSGGVRATIWAGRMT